MRGATRPISLRLAPCHIERLKGRDGFAPTSYAKNLFVPLTRIACSWGGSTADHPRQFKKSKCTRGLAGALQGVLESLLTPAERWRMSAVEGRTEVRIAGRDFRF